VHPERIGRLKEEEREREKERSAERDPAAAPRNLSFIIFFIFFPSLYRGAHLPRGVSVY